MLDHDDDGVGGGADGGVGGDSGDGYDYMCEQARAELCQPSLKI